ncbi:uncharacterized protein TrAFT101_008927 [Trichoderma asperellum]|uniref:Uncharacterized protein n=1 Tax=Trichoderma asperellum (strain ATCC 204424 / CBS 433.97 / NBRC 101777) TaxID=1042311 RepID=A0A2T3ZB20_TRIA4|nr:hypothetical protein M441DRAFT_88485 [Trichoderma asperellum CBS 433.97]PTB41970.1 hypothetical protein M441DRAFT_88485 [Trichoderma asperellum CBS 433.97]UKZ94033.1 hypothetical protein TrAFT101_008927 [Trichoderma asperellum]
MFEVPDAKRVRREDLQASDESSWSESEPDAELEARLNAQIARSLGLDESAFSAPKPQITLPVVTKPQVVGKKEDEELDSDEESEPKTPAEGSQVKEDGEDEDEVYAFRLFSAAGPAPQVVLENTNRVVEGKMIWGRPLSYYLVTDLSPEKKQQYEMAAVSGEDVIERSKGRAWGLELPWRVQTIKVTRKAGRQKGETVAHVEDDQPAKRKRPGKKRRVAMRIKARAKAQAEEAAKQKMAEKEEHIKDKKKRLNRLKKLRRRAKKKTEKGGGGEAGGESDEDMSDAEE